MDKTTRIRDLTETQILSAVRQMFEGEHVSDIKLEPLIDQSETLADLYFAIRRMLDQNQRPG
jgi:hypothetical protein